MDRRQFIAFSGLSAVVGCGSSETNNNVARAGDVAGRCYPAVIQTSPAGFRVIHDRSTMIEQMKYETWTDPSRNWKEDCDILCRMTWEWGQGVVESQRRPARVIDGVYLLGPEDYHQSVYLWDTGDGLLLVDPSYTRFQPQIEIQIRQLGYELSDVRWVLLTHMHWDHSQSAAQWESRGAPVYIHEVDRGYVTGELDLGTQSLPVDPVRNPVTYTDGETLAFGGLSLQAIHTPGHTPGSTCFSFEWAGTSGLISGDIALHFGRHAWMGAGYCDWDQYLASLWKLHRRPEAAGWKVMLPGHGTVDLDGAIDSLYRVILVSSEIIRRRRAGAEVDWLDPHELFWRRKLDGLGGIEPLEA